MKQQTTNNKQQTTKSKIAKYAMVAALSSSILFSKVDLAKAKENLEVNSTKIDDKAKIEIIKKEIAQMEKELSEKINKR
ncbi:TPA: hypothetical protein ACQMIR_001505, partial [Streptococcus pyogenes]